MSNRSAVSMQELELESGELLPGRETLCVINFQSGHGGSGFVQSGYGDTVQSGLVNGAIANGSLNNLLANDFINVGPINVL